MLLRIFQSTQPAALFGVLPILILVLWLSGLIHPQTIPPNEAMPLFEAIANLLNPFPRGSVFIALLFTYFQALLINGVVNKHEILPHKSNMVALMFVVLMSCFDMFLTIHPVLFANLFLLLALNRIGSIYRKENIFSEVLDAGALVSIASLFYFPAIVLFLFIWTALVIIRPFIWREYVISFIGLLLPYIFVAAYYYFYDMLNHLLYDKMFFAVTEGKLRLSDLGFSNYLLFGSLGLLLIASLTTVINTVNKTVLRTQNLLWTLVAFLFFSALAIIVAGNNSVYVYGLMSIPASVFFANFFFNFKKKRLGESLFLVLLLIILYHHFVG